MTNLRLADQAPPAKKSRIGLNLAGGGPLGGMYEIGALCALKESLDGIDFNELDVYVGVSVGSLLAASLANGITPESLYRIMIGHRAAEYSFQPESFLRPAFREYSQRAKSVPKLVMEAFVTFLANPGNISLKGAFATLGRAIPTGVFDGDQIAPRTSLSGRMLVRNRANLSVGSRKVSVRSLQPVLVPGVLSGSLHWMLRARHR